MSTNSQPASAGGLTTDQCPNCGANLPAGDGPVVCRYCGTALRRTAAPPPVEMLHLAGELVSFGLPNQAPLLAALQGLIQAPSENNFLIASSGDYYIQFMLTERPDQLYCEAVSNRFLQGDRRLRPPQEATLIQYGFRLVDSGNYGRDFNLSDAEALAGLAHLTAQLFVEVYGCAPQAPLSFET